jgi:hypothetical protein
LKRKAELMGEMVAMSVKVLEEEIKHFRKTKEIDM